MEVDKGKRSTQEQHYVTSDLKIKLAEVDQLKIDNSSLTSKVNSLKMDFSVKEKELMSRLEAVQHQRDMLQREHDVMREKINIQKHGLEQAQSENIRIRSDLEHAIIDRDRTKRDIALKETQFNEQQLHDLKRDLEQTVSEWQGLEKEKSLKDKVIQQYKDDLHKEHERSTLLKMQNDLLEERLKVANQELSVFRGINVYHSSMQAELQLYRKEKAAATMNNNSINSSSSHMSIDNMLSATTNNDMDISTSSSVADNIDRDIRLLHQGNKNKSSTTTTTTTTNHLISSMSNPRDDEVRRSISSVTDLNRSIDYPMQQLSMEEGRRVTNTSAQLSMKDLMSSDETVVDRFNPGGSSTGARVRRAGEMEHKQSSLPDEEEEDGSEHYMFTLYNTKLDDYNAEDHRISRTNHSTNHNNNNNSNNSNQHQHRAYRQDKPSQDYSSSSNSSTKAAVAAVISEKDRQEILRQKNERKAARDQLLREKILKDHSYRVGDLSSSGGGGGAATRSAAILFTPTSSTSNPQDTKLSSSLLSKLRTKESSTPDVPPPKLPTSPIVMARDFALRKPSKTDFERARRLLSM